MFTSLIESHFVLHHREFELAEQKSLLSSLSSSDLISNLPIRDFARSDNAVSVIWIADQQAHRKYQIDAQHF